MQATCIAQTRLSLVGYLAHRGLRHSTKHQYSTQLDAQSPSASSPSSSSWQLSALASQKRCYFQCSSIQYNATGSGGSGQPPLPDDDLLFMMAGGAASSSVPGAPAGAVGEENRTINEKNDVAACETIESEGNQTGPSSCSSSNCTSSAIILPVVQLHNMPRNWMHEEIVEFIHSVAMHAGIPEPAGNDGQDRQGQRQSNEEDDANVEEEGDSGSAIPQVTSCFIQRLSIPFGRRTGLVYGVPTITLTSPDLAKYLVEDLSFDPDDYRNRIHFSKKETSSLGKGSEEEGSDDGSIQQRRNITSFEEIEESVEEEQAEALRTLTLDRYLMAPDLLLDIAKMNQRRLVTSNEKVLLDAFLDDPDNDNKDEASESDGSSNSNIRASKKKTSVKKRTGKVRRARSLKQLGRGSLMNTPIPKPYVQGRRI